MWVLERGWRVAVLFKTPARASATMPGMALEMRLGWVIAYVDDPPAAAELHERTFGLKPEFVVHDVEAAYAAALDAGCASLAAPEDKPQGQRVAYVRDPFGTLVELAAPL
jgi:uncharacterized glyoxalase superfamily protein PhnB